MPTRTPHHRVPPCIDVARRAALGGALLALMGAAVPAVAQMPNPALAQTLLSAAEAGDVAAIRRALDAGASIEARDARGRTPVLLATYGGHVAAAQWLMARGADVNAQDDQRNSAFLLAGARGHTEIVRAALASTNRYGGTALIPACHYGHAETVRLLLGTPMAVDHVNNLGWTALLEAVILGDGGPRYQQIVRLLLGRQAQPNLADLDGVTPVQHAQRRGFTAVAELLRGAGGR